MSLIASWLMGAPLLALFAAGMIIGIPLWLLIFTLSGNHGRTTQESPYAHAQQQYEEARDRYQAELAARLAQHTKEGK